MKDLVVIVTGGANGICRWIADELVTGFWAARITEITKDDTVLTIGADLLVFALCFA